MGGRAAGGVEIKNTTIPQSRVNKTIMWRETRGRGNRGGGGERKKEKLRKGEKIRKYSNGSPCLYTLRHGGEGGGGGTDGRRNRSYLKEQSLKEEL